MKTTILCGLTCLLLLPTCIAQAPPVHETTTLPSGQRHPIYSLPAYGGVSPVCTMEREQRSRKANMADYDGLIYPTQDRVFFATPIDEDAYYLVTGVSGVYDDVGDLTAGPAV
ncbi:MAG: hypothetical protein R6V19_04380, partial [Armatimonadota bacterium]